MNISIGNKIIETIGKTKKQYEIRSIEIRVIQEIEVTIIKCKLLTSKGKIDKRTWTNEYSITIWDENKNRYQIIL